MPVYGRTVVVKFVLASVVTILWVSIETKAEVIVLQPDASEGKDTFVASNTGPLAFRSELNRGASDSFVLERQSSDPNVSAILLINFDVYQCFRLANQFSQHVSV